MLESALACNVMVVPLIAVTVLLIKVEPTTSDAGTVKTVTVALAVELDSTLTVPGLLFGSV